MQVKVNNSTRFEFDYPVLGVSLALLMIGLVMVASASMTVSARSFGGPMHFFLHQALFASVGLVFALVILRMPMRIWYELSPVLLLLSVCLLGAVLVPGLGRTVNGSVRWLKLGGGIGLQVSEFAKLAIILYIGRYLAANQQEVQHSWRGFVKPIAWVGVLGVLLLLEPDFGATTVIATVVMGMLFLAGAQLRQFWVLLAGCGSALAGLILIAPYRLERMTNFLHPWAHQFSGGYQLTQSLIAFGRGGFWGVGLGNSIQKLFYLPEAHTDFLFAVLAEELGLFGSLCVIGLFVALVWRGLAIGRHAERHGQLFAGYVAYGLSLWVGLQSMINIGVNSGLLPTKGITLPLMSYGGSSMVIQCLMVAIILRIHHESQHPHQYRQPSRRRRRR